MKAAIMQPYFFPYIGYFQLMHAVDTFVVYDDVQYTKGGWINRNLIRSGATAKWLTLPVCRDHLELPINQRRYQAGPDDVDSAKRRLREAYGRQPAYAEVAAFVDGLLEFSDRNVASYNANLLKAVGRTLGARCEFVNASSLGDTRAIGGQQRVIELCRRLGAETYINASGGRELYASEDFEQAGIALSFLQTCATPVPMDEGPRHLSILDALYVQGISQSATSLGEYVVDAA